MTDSAHDPTHYVGALLEEIREQNKAVLEVVGDMRTQVAKLSNIEKTVEELSQDTKVVKVVVTDLSYQVSGQERRIGGLKAAR